MKDVDMSLGKETGANGNPSLPSRDPLSVTPSANSHGRYSDSSAQLVYALGRIGYDFVSRSRRDSIEQMMQEMRKGADPEKHEDMLAYLDKHPDHASAIQWTLNLDEKTPIYVIEPCEAFARDAYEKLRKFLDEQVQVKEGVEIVSIPGVISGMTRLRSGQALPVIAPENRGTGSWQDVVSTGVSPELKERVSNFLKRVYYEFRNLGREPQERALNFAATMALNEVKRIFDEVNRKEEMELDTIEVERSPVCRHDSDCWDVRLIFFFPQRQVQTVRKVYRFTVDVRDVVPATVGEMRSWSIR